MKRIYQIIGKILTSNSGKKVILCNEIVEAIGAASIIFLIVQWKTLHSNRLQGSYVAVRMVMLDYSCRV